MIKYVFWDSDNTLVTSADLHWRKHRDVLARYGLVLADAFQGRIYHNNGQQNWEWLSNELGLRLSCREYLDEIDAWYMDHLSEGLIRDGVVEAIAYFKGRGARQAVVSNGRRRSVMAMLEAKSLIPHFDFILCKEDYAGRKPEPAPYLHALQVMEELTGNTILREDCLAIEDDPLGVTSAWAAGIPVIHRRLHHSDLPAPEALASVHDGDEFLALIRSL